MAQDRMEESSATVKALYGTENPCSIKGAPELGEIMQKFIYSDVNNQVKMPLAQKELLTLVVLTANNTPEDIGIHVKGALNAGATPEEIRETLYQCTPYVGFARSKAALIERMESRHGIHTVEAAHALGLGSRDYDLVKIG